MLPIAGARISAKYLNIGKGVVFAIGKIKPLPKFEYILNRRGCCQRSGDKIRVPRGSGILCDPIYR